MVAKHLSAKRRGSSRRQTDDNQQQDDDNRHSALSTRIISGSVGSLVTSLVVTPLEVVKIHLQNTKEPARLPAGVTLCPRGCGTFVLFTGISDCTLAKSAVPYFDKQGNFAIPGGIEAISNNHTSQASTSSKRTRGTLGMIRYIFVKEGFRGIYAGLAPTLVMGIPSTALYYSVYDELIIQMQKTTPEKTHAWLPLFAGSSARLLSTMVTAPLELIRTRQASMVGQGSEVTGMVADFKAIVKEEGFGALYRGLSPTLWRDVPFSGIYWLSLEGSRDYWQRQFLTTELFLTPTQQAGITFLGGMSAGVVAAACTTPFDVVKTRQQAVLEENVVEHAAIATCNHDNMPVYEAKPFSRSASVFESMKAIYEQEGLRGLWRGNQTRMIKVAPSCAIMITCYEMGKRALASDD